MSVLPAKTVLILFQTLLTLEYKGAPDQCVGSV